MRWVPPTSGLVTSWRGVTLRMPKTLTVARITATFTSSAAASLIAKKSSNFSIFIQPCIQIVRPRLRRLHMKMSRSTSMIPSYHGTHMPHLLSNPESFHDQTSRFLRTRIPLFLQTTIVRSSSPSILIFPNCLLMVLRGSLGSMIYVLRWGTSSLTTHIPVEMVNTCLHLIALSRSLP